jgi:hypothetical protein
MAIKMNTEMNMTPMNPSPELPLLLPLPPGEAFPGPPEYPEEPELPPILLSSSLEKDERGQTTVYNTVFSLDFISLVTQTACPEPVSSGWGMNSGNCSMEVSSTTFISFISAKSNHPGLNWNETPLLSALFSIVRCIIVKSS